jgi:hypothetical protein
VTGTCQQSDGVAVGNTSPLPVRRRLDAAARARGHLVGNPAKHDPANHDPANHDPAST